MSDIAIAIRSRVVYEPFVEIDGAWFDANEVHEVLNDIDSLTYDRYIISDTALREALWRLNVITPGSDGEPGPNFKTFYQKYQQVYQSAFQQAREAENRAKRS